MNKTHDKKFIDGASRRSLRGLAVSILLPLLVVLSACSASAISNTPTAIVTPTISPALQRQGVPSKLVIFPDEGHWVLKPQNSKLWYHEFFGWLAEYLK